MLDADEASILDQVAVIEKTATEISAAAIALSEKSKGVTNEAMELAMLASKLLSQASQLRRISRRLTGERSES